MVSTRRNPAPFSQPPPTTPSKQRKTWELILKTLKQALQNQNRNIQALLHEREFLQLRLLSLHDTWNSDVLLFENQISRLKRELELTEILNAAELAKADFCVRPIQKDVSKYKLRLGHAQSELEDFKSLVDMLSHRCPDTKDISIDTLYEILNDKEGFLKKPSEKRYKMLEKEVATLRSEYEKLSKKNSLDVSDLQAENKFAWNQYNKMEEKYADQLRATREEFDQANEKIRQLLDRLEQLQLTISEKDDTVATLRASISKLEAEKRQKDEEISTYKKESAISKSKGLPSLMRCSGVASSSGLEHRRNSRYTESSDVEKESTSGQLEVTIATLKARINDLEAEANHKNKEIDTLSKELNLLRPGSAGNTPCLRSYTNEPSSSSLRGRGNLGSRGTINPKEEASSALLASEKGLRRSTRKRDDPIIIEETPVPTPRLFTSQFKIPKLKSQSPRGR